MPNPGWMLEGAGRVDTAAGLTLRWAGSGVQQALAMTGAPDPDASGDAAKEGAAAPPGPQNPDFRPDAWFEGTVSADPATLQVGGSVKVELAGDIVEQESNRSHVVRRGSFRGEFMLTSAPAPGGRLLLGTITGTARLAIVSPARESAPEVVALNAVKAVIERSTTPDGGPMPAGGTTVTIRLEPADGLPVTASVTWHGAADRVRIVASYTREPAPAEESRAAPGATQLVSLSLDRMPAAAAPGHADRVAPEQALATLERRVDELGDAPARLLVLFPERTAGTALRATLDDVLFRRAAPLRCGGLVTPPAATETFEVWGRGSEPANVQERSLLLGEITFGQGTPSVVVSPRRSSHAGKTSSTTTSCGTSPCAPAYPAARRCPCSERRRSRPSSRR